MKLNSFYPVLMTTNVKGTADFYQRYFNFAIVFEANWYVSLQHEQTGVEMAVLLESHETVPAGLGKSIQGLILNFEVEDVDAVYQRLIKEEQLPEKLPLTSEAFGQRHFITTDPNGVLIDVITVIAPEQSYEGQYKVQVWKEANHE